jgi:protein-S-isoprenylcysteine O-methyltransferase Ste14
VLIRGFGTLLALAAHLLLPVTVWFLFPFLMGGSIPTEETAGWWRRDLFLIVQFSVSHSVLLVPSVRQRIGGCLPGPLYGCFFTATTCLSLLFLILAWQTSSIVLWNLDGWARFAIQGAYVLSWGALIYTMSPTGYGFQTGWTPFWSWVRGQPPPRRRFVTRGVYQWLRHPVYLSFLGQIWFTPTMTLDRGLLTGLLTIYIFIGSALKDRRLVGYLGDVYRQYQERVPGYPLIGFGPLGRVPFAREKSEPVRVKSAELAEQITA